MQGAFPIIDFVVDGLAESAARSRKAFIGDFIYDKIWFHIKVHKHTCCFYLVLPEGSSFCWFLSCPILLSK